MDKYVKVDWGTQLQRGKCTFARKDIKQGVRIILDPPLLHFGALTDPHEIYSQFLGLNSQNRKAILDLSSRPSQERHYLSRINKQDLGQLWALCSSKHPSRIKPSKEEAAKVLAVFEDNQVQLQYESRPELSLKIARINHSCVPNVAVAWNSRWRMYTVHAIKDIQKGEEILYSYVYLPEPREYRQEQLRRWEIECKCSACAFENVGMEEQKQELIRNDKKDESRPRIKRRSTGELNAMWFNQPTAQSSENRRWQWKIKNECMNKTNDDDDLIGRATTYKAMIEFLGDGGEMLEERIRLYSEILCKRELDYGDEDRKGGPEHIQYAYEQAVKFAEIAYGQDGDKTVEIRALGDMILPEADPWTIPDSVVACD